MARRSSSSGKAAGKLISSLFMLCIWIVILPIMVIIKLYKAGKINKKVAAIVGSVLGVVWFVALFASAGKAGSNEPIPVSNDTRAISETSDAELVSSLAETEVSAVSLSAGKVDLILGETIKLDCTVLPDNATNKSIVFSSDDQNILAVTKDGLVSAVGAGSATITGLANNGISAVLSFSVDGTKRVMKVYPSSSRINNEINIGDEWSYVYEINGERFSRGEYILSVGDTLTLKATITEDDKKPDVGYGTVKHIVTAEDILNGFSESFEVRVTENGGKNSGKTAVFTVSFDFRTE